MLILKRKKNDSILIGNDIRITVLDCDNGSVSLAINAPKHISIFNFIFFIIFLTSMHYYANVCYFHMYLFFPAINVIRTVKIIPCFAFPQFSKHL